MKTNKQTNKQTKTEEGWQSKSEDFSTNSGERTVSVGGLKPPLVGDSGGVD